MLALTLLLPGQAGAAASAPQVSGDGSLMLDTGGDSRKKGSASKDTLYEVLGQEVQVFIFNHKTRVWPTVNLRYATGWGGRTTPQLEALISKYSTLYGVDPSLVRAVIRHESGFNSGAVSPKGAQGLMQLMPGTAALMGVNNPFDPEQNIAGGVGYLRRCLDRFQHNVPLAVAAYNAGPEAVAKYCTVPPYAETQAFVQNVVGTYTAQGGKPGDKSLAGTPGPAPGRSPALAKKSAPAEGAKEKPRRSKAKIIEVRPVKSQRATARIED
jgi:hypothetical protein